MGFQKHSTVYVRHTALLLFLLCTDHAKIIVQVITNGYFSLEMLLIQHVPQLFPLVGQYLVAPFWSDVNVEDGAGTIQYEIHSSTTGGTALQDVSAFISSEEDIVFEAEWMLVAEWEEVTLSAGPPSSVNNFSAHRMQ